MVSSFFLVKYPVVDMHLIDIILAPFSQLFYCRSTPFEDLTCFIVGGKPCPSSLRQ